MQKTRGTPENLFAWRERLVAALFGKRGSDVGSSSECAVLDEGGD